MAGNSEPALNGRIAAQPAPLRGNIARTAVRTALRSARGSGLRTRHVGNYRETFTFVSTLIMAFWPVCVHGRCGQFERCTGDLNDFEANAH